MGLSFQEILIIAVIALVVFGPDRLPELARQAGKALARFRQETSRSVDELKRAADIGDLDRELRGLSRDLRDVRRTVTRAIQAEPTSVGAPRDDDLPPPTDPEAT